MGKNGVIGRVTRCSTRGFAGAYSLRRDQIPSFGAFCSAPYQEGGEVIGVIYDISIEDDQLARQIASLDDIPEEQILDSQNHRQLPIEFSVLTLGYHDGERIHQTLAPHPPLTLETIKILEASYLIEITEDFRFLHTIAQAVGLPTDDLMIAAIKTALLTRPEADRRSYLLGAGRMLARLLAADLQRLENILAELSRLESILGFRSS